MGTYVSIYKTDRNKLLEMFTFENIKHNMKTFRKIGCLLLIATFSFPCFAKKRIYLKGKWDTAPKSIIPKRPIQA